MKSSVYLKDIPLKAALAQLENSLKAEGLWRVLGRESLPLDENALGRVTAETIWAKISSPHYHASAMDGFAVLAEDTSDAQPTAPISILIEFWIGESKTRRSQSGQVCGYWRPFTSLGQCRYPDRECGIARQKRGYHVGHSSAAIDLHSRSGCTVELRASARRGYSSYAARAACRAYSASG